MDEDSNRRGYVRLIAHSLLKVQRRPMAGSWMEGRVGVGGGELIGELKLFFSAAFGPADNDFVGLTSACCCTHFTCFICFCFIGHVVSKAEYRSFPWS